jgi:hypothetical protein
MIIIGHGTPEPRQAARQHRQNDQRRTAEWTSIGRLYSMMPGVAPIARRILSEKNTDAAMKSNPRKR